MLFLQTLMNANEIPTTVKYCRRPVLTLLEVSCASVVPGLSFWGCELHAQVSKLSLPSYELQLDPMKTNEKSYHQSVIRSAWTNWIFIVSVLSISLFMGVHREVWKLWTSTLSYTTLSYTLWRRMRNHMAKLFTWNLLFSRILWMVQLKNIFNMWTWFSFYFVFESNPVTDIFSPI